MNKKCFYYLMFLVLFLGCKKGVLSKEKKHFLSNLSDSVFIKDEIKFYKFHFNNNFDNLFFSLKNDTLFCYDSNKDFYDIFIILNDKEKRYLSWIGNDYKCELIGTQKNKSEDLYFFKFDTINDDYIDVVSRRKYPRKIFKSIKFSKINGFIEFNIYDKIKDSVHLTLE
ncbi:hypothetical protein F7018_17640 [Tenacibaculum aiptasiae]|uniref:Lipoprotein n=1 Tax=Tenacibaculum aiptasiae TaxID=426481 RepID=A0A7J5A6J5_9FLAO|nr:hypothetical protein [Tenacibaculum aiptasiae]KAB1153170.1 hypothetical protein F7018_17640 [Tenacibaculum aiptasiae]